jgi:hypothetical protein
MIRKATEKESGEATLLDVKREMAEPRRAKSARDKEVAPATSRTVRRKRGKTEL